MTRGQRASVPNTATLPPAPVAPREVANLAYFATSRFRFKNGSLVTIAVISADIL